MREPVCSDIDLTHDAGNNVLSGRPGADTLDGGEGIDAASYSGSSAGVTVRLLTGTDRFYGGHGQDTASYYDSPESVTVHLHSLAAAGGDATGDIFPRLLGVAYTDADGNEQTESLPDVEHLTGSAHDDILAGDRRDNDIDGGAGNDDVSGGQGADSLIGGPGDGSDAVTDFSSVTDKIDLTAFDCMD